MESHILMLIIVVNSVVIILFEENIMVLHEKCGINMQKYTRYYSEQLFIWILAIELSQMVI